MYVEDASPWVYACLYICVYTGVIKFVQKYVHSPNSPTGAELTAVFLENQEFPSSIFYIHRHSKRNEEWIRAGENTFHLTVLTPLYQNLDGKQKSKNLLFIFTLIIIPILLHTICFPLPRAYIVFILQLQYNDFRLPRSVQMSDKLNKLLGD